MRARGKCENYSERIKQNKKQTRIQKAPKPRAFIKEINHTVLYRTTIAEEEERGNRERREK